MPVVHPLTARFASIDCASDTFRSGESDQGRAASIGSNAAQSQPAATFQVGQTQANQRDTEQRGSGGCQAPARVNTATKNSCQGKGCKACKATFSGSEAWENLDTWHFQGCTGVPD